LSRFKKIKKVAQVLRGNFFHTKGNALILPKQGMGYILGDFFTNSFFPRKVTFRGKFRGICRKNDFLKLFLRKIPIFSNIFGGKFSAEFSPEKMYEKLATLAVSQSSDLTKRPHCSGSGAADEKLFKHDFPAKNVGAPVLLDRHVLPDGRQSGKNTIR
jgi:hypothetical protein